MSRAPLVTYDFEGEPWLDNPHLIVANPRKKGGGRVARAKRRRGRRGLLNLSRLFRSNYRPHKKGRKATMRTNRRKSRSRARVFRGRLPRKFARKFRKGRSYHGLLVARGGKARVAFRTNPRRRHHKKNKRHYRHNPQSVPGLMSLPFGLKAPAVKDIAFGAMGLFIPGMISSKVVAAIPSGWITSTSMQTAVTWTVKVLSVLVPGVALMKWVDRRAGYAFLIGGTASLIIDAVRTFIPSVSQWLGLGFQPLLGYYPGGVILGGGSGMGDYSPSNPRQRKVAQAQPMTPVLLGVPDRLNPAGRF